MKLHQTITLAAILTVSFLNASCSTAPSESLQQPVKNNTKYWSHKFGVVRDIQYAAHEKQRLDIYQQGYWSGPPNYFQPHANVRPTLIYIHGGAWHGGSKESAVWSIMPFVENGWQVVNVEYRAGPNSAPNAAIDIELATQWLVENAEEYAIDINNVVFSGDSAGGHLALYGGLRANNLNLMKVKAIINWFGISDIATQNDYLAKNKRWNFVESWAGQQLSLEELVSGYSPINLLRNSSPPILSIHGTNDKVVPIAQSEILLKKLKLMNNETDHRLLRIDGGRHLGFTDQQFQQIFNEVFSFVSEKVTGKS